MHTLMYHDVFDEGTPLDASGFAGADAAIYKLSARAFDDHLDTLAATLAKPPVLIGANGSDLRSDEALSATSAWCLTFDDGGVSAWKTTASLLENRGWRGHFFITTERIGQPGFLDHDQIIDLHRRGHVIGSHSHTHPPRLSALTEEAITAEWLTSSEILREIIGCKTLVASVPGGFYSETVGKAAAVAGIRLLFTSEPISRPAKLNDCLLLGRYAIKDHMSAKVAAKLAVGRAFPVLSMRLAWALRKIAKRLGGQAYLDLRKALLRH